MNGDAEIAALLGGDNLAPPALAEPDSPRLVREAVTKAAAGGKGTFVEAGQLMRPVTRGFLTQITRLDEKVVQRRLLHCPTIGRHGQRDLYDFMTAISYLVEPRIDLEQYIRSLNPKKLPPGLNKDVWDALHKRLRYQRDAGDAWHTEDVIAVFGAACMTIKERLQLIVETMRDRAGLNDEQATRFTELIDGLRDDLHTDLVEMPQRARTAPMVEDDVTAEVLP